MGFITLRREKLFRIRRRLYEYELGTSTERQIEVLDSDDVKKQSAQLLPCPPLWLVVILASLCTDDKLSCISCVRL